MLDDAPDTDNNFVNVYIGSHHHASKDRLTYCVVIERKDVIGAREIYEHASIAEGEGGAEPAGYIKAIMLALEETPKGIQARINSDQEYIINYCGMSDFERNFTVINMSNETQQPNMLDDALRRANKALTGTVIPSKLITEENTAAMRFIDLANEIAALSAPHQQRRHATRASSPKKRHGSSVDALTIL